ncbi:BMP family ABC transporter substrate-binding protein [Bacillus sp. CGMCC 1.16607]|uniref:BMP family ABC transporter substrate-binding protein n=1 Tax=Bacillus sp. CGMCC 1.16607 TaxID=3351842 RepID=UPI00362D8E2D
MYKHILLIVSCFLLLVSCEKTTVPGNLHKVGLLVPETVNDQVWGTKGYKGLLKIQSDFNVDVYYKEGMDRETLVRRAVKEFDQKGVNLIFGHGNEYADYFNHIAKEYPDIHFVSFNGDATESNTTSLSFESHAMGFFGGMVAGHMTKSNKIGVIAAFDWQPEIEGFKEGVMVENPDAIVKVKYVGHWDDKDRSLQLLDELLKEDFDTVYPAGDGYNVPVIEKMKESGKYVIGYISEQSDLGETTVLTSTIQHVDALYGLVAKKYQNNELDSGNLYFDFQDRVITLGKFSPLVDKEFKRKIEHDIQNYIETKKLPIQ